MKTKFLLFIKSIFLKFGIEVSFVRKRRNLSAILLNDVEQVNKAWADPEIDKRYNTPQQHAFYQKLIDLLEAHDLKLSHRKVADVGCGSGLLLKYLCEKDASMTAFGYEYSESAIKVASKIFPKAEYFIHDINYPLAEKYDVVFSTEVLEHILYTKKVLINLIEMLNDDGFLLVTVPDGRIDTFEGHINFWSIESWKVFIEENTGGLKFDTGFIDDRNLFAIIYK